MKFKNIAFHCTKNKDYKGFSIAELLLALVIVGIVASCTIPILINNMQETQYRIAWKQCYSMLEQATKRIILDRGGSFAGVTGNGEHQFLMLEYAKYINTTKKCGWFCTGAGYTWPAVWKYIDGTEQSSAPGTSMISVNNMSFAFHMSSGACTNNNFPNIGPICGLIYADTNGFKGPNTVGKDIFVVLMQEDRIRPQGYNSINACTNADQGWGCSAKYLNQ